MKEDIDMFSIPAIYQRVATQHNDYTAEPYFVVQEKILETGLDLQWTSDVVWLDEESDAFFDDSEEYHSCEEYLERYHREPDGWIRTGYDYHWEGRQFFLTREAAEHYIKTKSHRHSGVLRVYTESAHDNPEIKKIRRLLQEISR